MWNNTRLLNLLANVMFGVAILIVLKLAAIAVLNSSRFPVRSVRLSGELAQISPDLLADAFTGRVVGNFFSADLGAVREWVEGVPWVRRASVRRAWPDRLEIRVEAHHALARWSDGELVNSLGELFDAETSARLPQFSGPPGTEKDVAERYRRFCDVLAPLQQQPAELKLTPRFAWELRLQDGLLLELGRDGSSEDVDERLARFVRIFPSTLAKYGRHFDYVDLRYPNGFALRVPDVPRFLKGTGQSPAEAEDPAAANRTRGRDPGKSAAHARGTRPA